MQAVYAVVSPPVNHGGSDPPCSTTSWKCVRSTRRRPSGRREITSTKRAPQAISSGTKEWRGGGGGGPASPRAAPQRQISASPPPRAVGGGGGGGGGSVCSSESVDAW